jgi:hypothetical protein
MEETQLRAEGRTENREGRLGHLARLLTLVLPSTGRTPFCKHEDDCLQTNVKGFLSNMVLGFGVKAGISLLFAAKKALKEPKEIVQAIFNMGNVHFGLFLGSFSSIFKGLVCLLRRAMGEDRRLCTFVAGFLAGLASINFLEEKNKKMIALFLLARALDACYQSLLARGVIPKWKYDYVLLFSCLMVVTGYCYANEPNCMPPDLNKFYLRFTNETINDLQIRSVWIEQRNRQLALQGIAPIDPLEYMPKLKRFYEKHGRV